MSGRTVTSSVEVAIDPAAAFTAFTEELGSWWLQGPINFHDSSRAYGLRMELGVGGRILEVYDDATGEGLELGRITAWEPGVRLSWTSSLDDVATEVTFRAAGRGTLVRVVATVPDGGLDAGGSSFVRVTPAWFARWTARRGRLPTAPEALSRLLVAVHCEHPGAAARWLQHAFGLELVSEIDDGGGDGGDGVWIELRAGSSAIVLLDAAHEGVTAAPSGRTVPWIFVDDLDAHHARARAAGADVDEPWRHGVTAYAARDLEGNVWTFAQAGPRTRASDG